MKILLAEDGLFIAKAMMARLKSFGHEVSIAQNGKEAFEIFCGSPHDLVLMDIEMPLMNGFEATAQIRRFESTQHWAWTPIIFLTASDSPEHLVTAIEAGGDDYMVKGLPEEVLHAKMKALARIAGMRQRLTEAYQDVANAHQEAKRALDDLRSAQIQLIQAEKMASLGQLVAGVAHELNTPIGNSLLVAGHLKETSQAMATSVETGLRRSALNDFLTDNSASADVLLRNMTKAGELISSFKQVAVDRTRSQRRQFMLAEMIAESVVALGPSLHKVPHREELVIARDIEMNSFPGPLGQVLSHLVTNAVLHGLEGAESGCVTIEGMRAEDPAQVVLKVKDNGVGIPPDVLPNIFDPFFTTKRGRGCTGLGLHIAHNIVTQILGGTMSVESEPGKGSCFILILPLAPERRGGDFP